MATTINSYSVGFGMDAKNYIDGAKLSRSETNKLISDIKAARSPTENFAIAENRLTEAYNKGAIELETYNRLIDFHKSKIESAAVVVEKKATAMERLSHASNVVTAGITSARAAIDTFNATKDKIDEVADRVANTADQARSLGMTFNDLFSMQFAAKQAGAPLGAIETAIKQMMKRGFAGTDAKESFLQIADEISGMANQSERMQRAFEVFGKSGADVVLMLQEGRDAIEENIKKAERYNQLTEAQVIAAERYGDTVDEVNLAWEGTTNLLVSEFAPVMSLILEDTIKFKESLDGSAMSLQSITEMTTRAYGFAKDATEFANLPISNMKNLLNMDFSGWISDMKEGFTFNQAGEMVAELEKKRNELENAAAEREKEREEKKKQAVLEGIAEKEQEEKDAKERAIQEEEKKRLESEERIAQEALRVEERKQQEIERMMGQSIAAASRKFDDESKRSRALADQMKGPTDLEVGSAGAAKYMADLENRQFAETIAKDITPGETELIAEAQKQFELMQQANAKQTEQITALQRLIEITSQNGFRKTR